MTQLNLFDDLQESYPPVTLSGRIYIAGRIPKHKKTELGKQLAAIGIDSDASLSKYTHAMVMGNSISERVLEDYSLLEYNGYQIPKISIADLFSILDGTSRIELKEVKKQINITSSFLEKSGFIELDKSQPQHRLGQREILMPKTMSPQFRQALGNIGIYCSTYYDSKTTDYILLTKETEVKIKNGIKNSFIKSFSEAYNKTDSGNFSYKFIRESEIIDFIDARCTMIGDSVTGELIRQVKNNRI